MGDGPPSFPQDFPGPVVLGKPAQEAQSLFAHGAITLYGRPFQAVRLRAGLVTSRGVRGPLRRAPPTPNAQRPRAVTCARFGLFPFRSPLLGESRLLSFPPGTEMFHFPGFASPTRSGIAGHYPGWVAPLGDPRINACLAAPRGLSQLATPFIASWRQGIHRAPLVA